MAPILLLASITVAAVLVHGYHLGVDDAEIYVPAVKKAADPTLFPFGSEFFMSHAHLSFFSDLVGGLARVSGVSTASAGFAIYCGSRANTASFGVFCRIHRKVEVQAFRGWERGHSTCALYGNARC